MNYSYVQLCWRTHDCLSWLNMKLETARMETVELKKNLQAKCVMAKGSLNVDGVTLRADAFGAQLCFNAWIFIAIQSNAVTASTLSIYYAPVCIVTEWNLTNFLLYPQSKDRMRGFNIKWMVHPKMNILSSFANLVNLNYFLLFCGTHTHTNRLKELIFCP